MKAIGLIAALPQEIAPFLRQAGQFERLRLGKFTAYSFRLPDLQGVLVRSGVGLKRALAASRTLIAAARPDLLVSFGVAGSARPGPQVGDVVIARAACLLENAASIDSYFQLAQLSAPARQAVWDVLGARQARLLSGIIFTTYGSQELPPLPSQIVNPLLDMETAGIAQVASSCSIPLLGLRAISDSVEHPLPFDLAMFYDQQQNLRLGRLVTMLIRHPRRLAQAMSFSQNVKLASENLAVALFEALKYTDMLEHKQPG